MEILCDCGNRFNFGNMSGELQGFEFATSEDIDGNEVLLLHCLKCDKTIQLYSEDYVDDENQMCYDLED